MEADYSGQLKNLRDDNPFANRKASGANPWDYVNREHTADDDLLVEVFFATAEDSRESYITTLQKRIDEGRITKERAGEMLKTADRAHEMYRPWR